MILGSFRSALGSIGAMLGAIPAEVAVVPIPIEPVIEAPAGRTRAFAPPRAARLYVFAGAGGRFVWQGYPAMCRVTRRVVATLDAPTAPTVVQAASSVRYRLVGTGATLQVQGFPSSSVVHRFVRVAEPSTPDRRAMAMQLLMTQRNQPDAIDDAWQALQREQADDEDDVILALCGVGD